MGDVDVGRDHHVPAYDLGNGVFGDKGNNWASYAIARITNGAKFRWTKYGANNSVIITGFSVACQPTSPYV